MATADISTAYIGLGSNLEQPPRQIRTAIRAINGLAGTHVVADSGLFLSQPMVPATGPVTQPDYYNAVIKIQTRLDPYQLLDGLQQIEQAQHRKREQHWGPRTIDLDIIMFDDLQVEDSRLILPHPGAHRREFVLYPLCRIDDSLEVPGRGMLKDLIRRCPENGLQYLGTIEGYEK